MNRTYYYNGSDFIPGVPMEGIAPGSLVEVDDNNQIVSIVPYASRIVPLIIVPVEQPQIEEPISTNQ